MNGISSHEKQLKYMEYLQRETGERHHSVEEDAYQYKLIQMGDPRAGEETRKILHSGLTGKISRDPLRNAKYLFVACAALASRSAMKAGMLSERANLISDMFILKMDDLQSVDAVQNLHVEMMEFYANEVAGLDKKKAFSRSIITALDYIYEHLYEPLSVDEIADHVGLSRSYFSTTFKKEMEMNVSDYVTSRRIEAAKNMLVFSNFSYADIGNTLGFSSQSHFIRVFREKTGYTPKAYREFYSQERS